MTRKPRTFLFATVAGALSVVAMPAIAYQPYGKLDPGMYTVQVDRAHARALPAAGFCLIQGNNGTGGPERHLWNEPRGDISRCLFATRQAMFDNGQAVYRFNDAGFFGSEGERAYVLVNKRSGQCLHYDRNSGQAYFSSQGCDPVHGSNSSIWLVTGSEWVAMTPLKPFLNPTACLIFGNNGHDRIPSVYRWGNVPSDRVWCGLGSEWALASTGQGLFQVTKVAE